MGTIVQKCLYDYDCAKCRGNQTNCVAYAQKKWNDVVAMNQKYLSELEELKGKIANGELVAIVQGKWIEEPGKIPHCSECGEYSDDADRGAIICGFCGARMDMK